MSPENNGADDAAELVLRMKAIREPVMRRASVAEYLTRSEPDRAVRAIATLIQKAPGADGFTVALDAISAALSRDDLLDYDTRSELYAAAKEAGHEEVALLLLTVPAAGDEEIARLEDEAQGERPLRPRGRPLTLGERKSAARGHRRDALEPLLKDPHPDVIRVLLGNPHITEQDVLVIASRRPSIPAALAAVFDTTRWISRYAVRRALTLNPYTPIPIAVRLMTTLRNRDLADLAHDGKLRAIVRGHARSLLARRRDRETT